MKLAIINFDLEFNNYYVTKIHKRNQKNSIHYLTMMDKIIEDYDKYIIICKVYNDTLNNYIYDNNINNNRIILLTSIPSKQFTYWLYEKGFETFFDYEKLLQLIMPILNDGYKLEKSCIIKKKNIDKDTIFCNCINNITSKFSNKEKYTIILYVKEKHRIHLSEKGELLNKNIIAKQYYIEGISNDYEYLKINYLE